MQSQSEKPASVRQTKTFRLDIAYDGSDFNGWQWQPIGRTVQGCLAETLARINRSQPVLRTAGRTDTGVHAEQMTVRAQMETRLNAATLLQAINGTAPPDLSVWAISDVERDWNPRAATERSYYYVILNRQARSCLLQRRALHIRYPLNSDFMRAAGAFLVGRHDFTSFRSLSCGARHPVRTLTNLEVIRDGDLIYILVQGHAFLRNMVRIIAGTLLDAGRGEIPPESVKDILDARDRDRAGVTLAARGLTLAHIRYEDEPRYTAQDLLVGLPDR